MTGKKVRQDAVSPWKEEGVLLEGGGKDGRQSFVLGNVFSVLFHPPCFFSSLFPQGESPG